MSMLYRYNIDNYIVKSISITQCLYCNINIVSTWIQYRIGIFSYIYIDTMSYPYDESGSLKDLWPSATNNHLITRRCNVSLSYYFNMIRMSILSTVTYFVTIVCTFLHSPH